MARIAPLPPAPTRADAANFAAKADAFLPAIDVFRSQANDLADEVSDDAAAAAASAASALNAPGTSATSTTQLAIGAGAKAFAIQPGKAFVVGQFVTIAQTSTPGNWMAGQITAHDPTAGSLTVQVRAFDGAGTVADWTIGLSAPMRFIPATAADIWAGTSDTRPLTPAGLFTAQALQQLADATTITPDLAAAANFYLLPVVAGRTLGNPANAKYGQSGVIVLFQDATGGRSLAYGSAWKFPGGAPTLSVDPGACDVLSYFVASPDRILCTIARGFI